MPQAVPAAIDGVGGSGVRQAPAIHLNARLLGQELGEVSMDRREGANDGIQLLGSVSQARRRLAGPREPLRAWRNFRDGRLRTRTRPLFHTKTLIGRLSGFNGHSRHNTADITRCGVNARYRESRALCSSTSTVRGYRMHSIHGNADIDSLWATLDIGNDALD